MSPRTVPEWQGETPNTAIPPRVRVRVFDDKNGCCGRCGRKIAAGERWTLEHIIALINGGKNRESNLGVTCDWCLPDKNGEDVREKSKVAMTRQRHVLGKPKSKWPKRGFQQWRT